MKKLFITFIMALIGTTAMMAQTNPNRVLITDKMGNTKGYLVERIDSMWFAKIEGRIAAEIEYLGFNTGETGDTVKIAVTRTEGCQAFRIDCMPKNRADMLGGEDGIANYLDNGGSEYYWQDFTNADMTGYTFTPGVDYSIITVGYDQYGVACGAERYDFTAPKKELVGDCSIAYTIDEVTDDIITVSFDPADGVAGYAACLYKAGTAEQQFQQMGAMFGFTSLGEMVKAFGFNNVGPATNTWENNDPGTDYEIYVQAWDANGTFADMLIIPVTTKKLGGEGVAEMTIEIGDFSGDAVYGYYQIVTYTPNDQTSMHRDLIIEKEAFDKEWSEEKMIDFIQNEYTYDDQFGVDVAYWTTDPDTEYIAFSMGKNINDEWGPLARKEFKTPASPAAVSKKAGKVPARIVKKQATNGTTPVSIIQNLKKTADGQLKLNGK